MLALFRVLLFKSECSLKKLQAMNIKVGSSVIKLSSQVKNLGSWFDPNLNMRHHITNVCKAGFFYLHKKIIRRINGFLTLLRGHRFLTFLMGT